MHGLNCGRCRGERGPYLTAFEIAVKHGYEGSEEEWIETLQSVYTARVTDKGPYEWECSVTFEELMARVNLQEVHLLTMEGRTAFCNGYVKNIGSGYIRFQTSPFYDEDVGGYVYEFYELYASDAGTYGLADVYAPGMESITKPMLATAVQNELDGAVQKGAQAAKESYQTQEVGVDANGKLWVFSPTNFIPATEQPAKTEAMTCEVGLDGEGQLWSEGYKKPGTGIPNTDMNQTAQTQLQCAPIIYVRMYMSGDTIYVDWSATNLNGFANVQEAIYAGADVRMMLLTENYFIFCHPVAKFMVNGNMEILQIVFGGPELIESGQTFTETIAYYVLSVSSTSIQRIVVDL